MKTSNNSLEGLSYVDEVECEIIGLNSTCIYTTAVMYHILYERLINRIFQKYITCELESIS